ncbi:CinY protein [Streptomyces longispororuber]|uniref:CinY protein n=1 Tax=Streptomyces longispororuber TaxID=68230 RepID=UPI0033F0A93B
MVNTKSRIRRAALPLGACVVMAPALLTAQAQPANAFGTVNKFGQHGEHERITRAALACAPGAASDGGCFEPRSLDQVAGHEGTFGAVGSPDSDETFTTAAHCDDADFLDKPGYPRTREQATTKLRECVTHLQKRFDEGVSAAGRTLDSTGSVSADGADLGKDCTFFLGVSGRAKCNAVEGFGRALHGVQDFYSHSNWADKHDTARPLAKDNPPGLGQTRPAPFLDLTATGLADASVPKDLTTGCYTVLFGCSQRIEHSDVNKDNGLIDPVTGAATEPGTARGKVGDNFRRAVDGAIADTRRQWSDFRKELKRTYGETKGERIACVMTRDNPVRDCA